jgi:hypothetical protein
MASAFPDFKREFTVTATRESGLFPHVQFHVKGGTKDRVGSDLIAKLNKTQPFHGPWKLVKVWEIPSYARQSYRRG